LNGPFRVSLGLGRFFDPDIASPVLLALVGRINVFTIWVTILPPPSSGSWVPCR
jgi:hypothetical protein